MGDENLWRVGVCWSCLLPCLFILLSDCGGLESSPPTHSCVLTARLCVTWRSSQFSQKLLVPGQHLHPQLKCDFMVRKTDFSSCSIPPYISKADPGVKLAVLAALSQLTVWSAAWWCHLTALCLWLSDCILYPDISVGVRLLGRAAGHADVVFLWLGWPVFFQGAEKGCQPPALLLPEEAEREPGRSIGHPVE